MDNYYCFNYGAGQGKSKGFFNVHQGKGGAIYITMDFNTIRLDEEQVNALPIDLYKLEDFDNDLYIKFYTKNKYQ